MSVTVPGKLTAYEPIGSGFVFAISPDGVVANAGERQSSRDFYTMPDGSAFVAGNDVWIFAWLETDSEDTEPFSFNTVTIPTPPGGMSVSVFPNLHQVLTKGNESTLNAIIAKLFVRNTRELADNTGVVFAGINLNTGELVELPESVVQARVGGTGAESGQTTAPESDANFSGKLVTYKGGKYYTIALDQAIAKILTAGNLNTLFQSLATGTSQEITHFPAIGPNGIYKLPFASLPSGSGGGSSTPVSDWVDLPLGNYVTFPNNPRWFHFGTSPASTEGTTDMLDVELVFGPWANSNGQLTQTTIRASLKNRDGFAAEFRRNGPSRDAELWSFRQTDNSVKHYVYFSADYFAVGFIRGHGIGGASFNRLLTPSIGASNTGAINNRIPPAGKELWSTKTAKPTRDFNGAEHGLYHPLIIDAMAKMKQAFLTNPNELRAGRKARSTRWDEESKEIVVISEQQEIERLRDLGFLYNTNNTESQALLLNSGLPDRTGRVGVAISIPIPANTFVSPVDATVTISIASTPPGGLSLINNALSGTPSVSGVYQVTIKGTDTDGRTATTTFQLTIQPGENLPPFIPPIENVQMVAGVNKSVTLPLAIDDSGLTPTTSVSGETSSYNYNTSTRVLVLTIPLPGVFRFQYAATDNLGASSVREFVVTAVASSGSLLALTEPIFVCSTGDVTIQKTGGDGSPITYDIPGVVGATTDPGPHRLPAGVFGDPLTTTLLIRAIQSGNTVTRSFNFRAYCGVITAPNAPTAPTFTQINTVVGTTIRVVRPDFTPPSGATITEYIYSNIPPGLFIGIEGAGSGQVTDGIVRLYGSATTPGRYEISITAKSSNGGQTTAVLVVVVSQALTGGIAIENVTNPDYFSVSVVLENGSLLVTDTKSNRAGRYKFDGSGVPPFPTTLVGRRFPANGQSTIIQKFVGTEPDDNQERGTVTITFNII